MKCFTESKQSLYRVFFYIGKCPSLFHCADVGDHSMNGLIGHQLQQMTHHALHFSTAGDFVTDTNREHSIRHGVKVLRE